LAINTSLVGDKVDKEWLNTPSTSLSDKCDGFNLPAEKTNNRETSGQSKDIPGEKKIN